MSAIRNGQFKLKPATPSPTPPVPTQAPKQVRPLLRATAIVSDRAA